MLVENRRDVIFGGVGSANPAPLLLGIRHARLHSGSDDGKLQFCEHSRHLNEGLAHGVNVTLATVNGDATNNLQAHMLALDDVHNLTELLGTSGEARDLSAYESGSFLCDFQKQINATLFFVKEN